VGFYASLLFGLQVSVRIRPFLEQYDQDCIDGTPLLNGALPNTLRLPENEVTMAPEKGYKFHRVFNPEASNRAVFEAHPP
jgi:hypothetical protein